MNFDAVKDILISEAKKVGLDKYDVFFMESEGKSAETLKDEISSFSLSVNGGICFRCIVDGHIGSASTELLSEDEMRSLVFRAIENAKNIESDDEPVIYEGADDYAKISVKKIDLPDTSEIKDVALSLQKQTYNNCEYIADGTQSGVFSERFSMQFVNSSGLDLSHSAGMCGAYVQAVINKDGESQEAFDYRIGLKESNLQGLPISVIDDALSKLSAKEIDSGCYDVIFNGKQARALLSAFSSVFSAKNAQLGLSLLNGKEGEKIASDCITLIDDPMREDSPMQISFDGEGVATYKKSVIENGVLKTLLYDLVTAKKAGKDLSTGNGQRSSYADSVHIAPYSFYIASGEESKDELISRVQNGIYITEMKGLHAGANAVTGDFSIESAGFAIRDGKRAEAIHSFTVAGNFFDLLRSIEAVSNTVDFGMPNGFTCYGSPDILVRKMSVAGK
jgi:PmbA protein